MNSDQITVGDTLEFRTTVSAYPPSGGWTLKFRLMPRSSGSAIDITATTASDADEYQVQVAPTTTATWAAGPYSWASWVEKSGARHQVDSGQVELLPNPTATTTLDSRTTAQKTLDAIDAMILGSASLDQQEYTIGNRTLKRIPRSELLQMRSFYAREVANEEAQARLDAGLGAGNNKLRVRF